MGAPWETTSFQRLGQPPFRVCERLSRALIADAPEGRTPLSEAMRLTSVKSASTVDEHARCLGAA